MTRTPFPPIELATRVGDLCGADFVLHEEIGRSVRAEILGLLPESRTAQEASTWLEKERAALAELSETP